MKERSFHTPKGLHKKNLKEMVWRTEQKRNKKKVYTREQRNLRRARTQRRTMEIRKTKERSTWPSIPHQNTEQKELRGESRSREGSKWGVRTQGWNSGGLGGGENILRQPGFNPGSTKNRINHISLQPLCNTLLDKSVWQNASHMKTL